MKQIEYNGSFVCYNESSLDLDTFIKTQYLKDIIDSFDENIIVVLGGDGTMLRAIKENYQKGLKFLGINFGHKGFLLNSKEFVRPSMEYIVRKYPLLEVGVKNNGISKKTVAVNEIDVRSGGGKMISLDISLSKNQAINIEGDGLIISTPAGSTGYNSSLSGPIIPHTLKTFVITPKAPWKPKFQPSILVNDNENISIKNTNRLNDLEIYCDGNEFLKMQNKQELNIQVKKSKHQIQLIIAKDYLDFWDNKVLQEQGFLPIS